MSQTLATSTRCCCRTAGGACVLFMALSSVGCVGVDLKQATYQALRQRDCRLNDLNDICQQNYANEYQEYARLREDFMRDTGLSSTFSDPLLQLQ